MKLLNRMLEKLEPTYDNFLVVTATMFCFILVIIGVFIAHVICFEI